MSTRLEIYTTKCFVGWIDSWCDSDVSIDVVCRNVPFRDGEFRTVIEVHDLDADWALPLIENELNEHENVVEYNVYRE